MYQACCEGLEGYLRVVERPSVVDIILEERLGVVNDAVWREQSGEVVIDISIPICEPHITEKDVQEMVDEVAALWLKYAQNRD